MVDPKYVPFFLCGITVYIGIMILIGWISGRKSKEGSSFLTGGRRMPMFLIICTAAATMIGTGGTMGKTGQGFAVGLGAIGYAFGGAIAIFILAILFAPMRSKNFITMSEEMQYYYGGSRSVRKLSGVLMFVAELCFMASHMTGGAKYLEFVTGFNPIMCKLICLLAFTLYVYIGGYLAVVWTDVIQLGIILVGFVFMLIKSMAMIDGWSEISATFVAAGKPGATVLFGGGTALAVITMLVTSCFGEMGASTFRHRIYTSKNAQEARRSFLITSVVVAVFTFIPIILGMASFVIATRNGATEILANPDFAFAYIATNLLGPVGGLLLLIAGLSATMSSGDSDAICGVTIFIEDLYPTFTKKRVPEEKIKGMSRVALIVTLVLAFVLTLFATDFIDFIRNIIGSLMPAMVVSTIVGRLWKRVTPAAGMSGMVIGTLFGIAYLVIPSLKAAIVATFTGPAIPVALLTLVVLVVVTLCTKRPNLTEEEILSIVLKGRTDLETENN